MHNKNEILHVFSPHFFEIAEFLFSFSDSRLRRESDFLRFSTLYEKRAFKYLRISRNIFKISQNRSSAVFRLSSSKRVGKLIFVFFGAFRHFGKILQNISDYLEISPTYIKVSLNSLCFEGKSSKMGGLKGASPPCVLLAHCKQHAAAALDRAVVPRVTIARKLQFWNTDTHAQ